LTTSATALVRAHPSFPIWVRHWGRDLLAESTLMWYGKELDCSV